MFEAATIGQDEAKAYLTGLRDRLVEHRLGDLPESLFFII